MDKITRRNMINTAFKWRENIKRSEHENLILETKQFIILLMLFSQIVRIYNDYYNNTYFTH